MGPAGELRYPSCPSQKLAWAWHTRELGEFQCYDKVHQQVQFTCKLAKLSFSVIGRSNHFAIPDCRLLVLSPSVLI
jgi:hypothetical protein